MSYRRSRARREFETQLHLVVQELVPLYKCAQQLGGGSRLLAAYYIVAYSQLEVYIGSLVEGSLDVFNSSSPAFTKWPDLMLAYILHKSENLAADYRRFGVQEDEGAILEKVAQAARKIVSWSAGEAGFTVAYAADFLDKKKYPSPKNLPQLFRRLGVVTIWPVVDKVGRMDGKLILTSLNDLRTEIAHEGTVPPGFSFGDFRERLKQMGRFVAALDRGVAKHFCSGIITRADWNDAMS